MAATTEKKPYEQVLREFTEMVELNPCLGIKGIEDLMVQKRKEIKQNPIKEVRETFTNECKEFLKKYIKTYFN